MRGFIRQIQAVGDLRNRVVNKNQMGRIGRRQVADGGQHRILTRAALRIARGASRAGLHDAITVCERLDRLVGDRGRLWRTDHRT